MSSTLACVSFAAVLGLFRNFFILKGIHEYNKNNLMLSSVNYFVLFSVSLAEDMNV